MLCGGIGLGRRKNSSHTYVVSTLSPQFLLFYGLCSGSDYEAISCDTSYLTDRSVLDTDVNTVCAAAESDLVVVIDDKGDPCAWQTFSRLAAFSASSSSETFFSRSWIQVAPPRTACSTSSERSRLPVHFVGYRIEGELFLAEFHNTTPFQMQLKALKVKGRS